VGIKRLESSLSWDSDPIYKDIKVSDMTTAQAATTQLRDCSPKIGSIQSYALIPSTGLHVDSMPRGLRYAMAVHIVVHHVGNSNNLIVSCPELYRLLTRVSMNRAPMLKAEVIPERMNKNRTESTGCDKAWIDGVILGIELPMVSATHKTMVCRLL